MDLEIAQAIAENGDISDRLYLARNGVPFDVAFSLSEEERLAFVVILGTQDGNTFDWPAMRWSRRDA